MDDNVDYYSILGLIPEAEPQVIRAAYKALAALYHPDRHPIGDNDRIRDINKAYEVLSNSLSKQKYDSAREAKANSASSALFNKNCPFDESPEEESWNIAVRFHDHLANLSHNLETLSWSLAFSFRVTVLESQKFYGARHIHDKLRSNYLTKYFGSDHATKIFAAKVLKAGETEVALYLNSVVLVVGNSIDLYDIKSDVKKRYPDAYLRIETYEHMVQAKKMDSQSAVQPHYCRVACKGLIEALGGSVKEAMFGKKITLSLNNEVTTFKNTSEYFEYVQTKVIPMFE